MAPAPRHIKLWRTKAFLIVISWLGRVLASKRLLIMYVQSSSTLSIVACRVSVRCEFKNAILSAKFNCILLYSLSVSRIVPYHHFGYCDIEPHDYLTVIRLAWCLLAVKISIRISDCVDQVGMPFLRMTRLPAPRRVWQSRTLHAQHAVRSHFVQRRPPRYVRASRSCIRAHTKSATRISLLPHLPLGVVCTV